MTNTIPILKINPTTKAIIVALKKLILDGAFATSATSRILILDKLYISFTSALKMTAISLAILAANSGFVSLTDILIISVLVTPVTEM